MTTESVGVVLNKNTSLKFKWEINDFSMRCKKVGDFLESPKFTAMNINSNIQWHLRLYPKGKQETNQNYLAFYLYANGKVQSSSGLKIFNYKGNEQNVYFEIYALKSFEMRLNAAWELKNSQLKDAVCISRRSVQDSATGILINDTLRIMCEISLAQYEGKEIMNDEATNRRIKEQEDSFLSRLELTEKYENLLDDSKFSDVSLISSEGKAVKVHKCILAKSSSVFAAMFDADMKEKQENIVEIADIEYDVLVEMIRFIYAGKVNNINTLAGELAVAAEKYALDGLKKMCEKKMIKNLSLDNAIRYLELSDKVRMDELKKQAIEFIVENASDISEKPEFEMLPHDIVCKVFRSLAKKNK